MEILYCPIQKGLYHGTSKPCQLSKCALYEDYQKQCSLKLIWKGQQIFREILNDHEAVYKKRPRNG